MSETNTGRCIGWTDINGEVFIPSDGSERSRRLMANASWLCPVLESKASEDAP